MSEVRGELKQNFGPNQRVTITRTTDSSLDGASATVIGLVSNPGCDFILSSWTPQPLQVGRQYC